MGWSPTQPGLEEARRIAWVQFINNNLSDLNVSLARTTPNDFYSRVGLVPITSAMVESEDTETMWDLDQMPLAIRYTNGDQMHTQDVQAALFSLVSGWTGWQYHFCSYIYVYLHPQLFSGTNAQQQASDRGLCMDRIGDWMIGEVNSWNPATETGGTVLPLLSSVIGNPNDKLVEVVVTEITRDVVLKGQGDSEFYPGMYFKIESQIM